MAADTYPFSEPFQGKILALICRDSTFLSEHRDAVSPAYFDNDIDRTVCRLLLSYYDAYKASPSYQSFHAYLQSFVIQHKIDIASSDRLKAVLEKSYSIDITDDEYVKDNILDFASNQELKRAIIETVDMMQSGGLKNSADYEKVRDMMNKALAIREGGSAGAGFQFFNELQNIPQLVSSQSRYERGKIVKTFFPSLDECLIGGLGSGQLGIAIAPPKRGKSAFLVNLGAAALVQGKTVVHVTFELDELDVALRYSSRMTGIPMNDIILGKHLEEYHLRTQPLVSMYKNRHLVIKYERPNTVRPGWVRNYLNKQRSVFGIKPDLVIIDYMDLFRKKYEGDLYVSGGLITQELIGIAMDFQCGIWTASQAGRQASQAEIVNVDDVAESWKKVADADVVLTLNQTKAQKVDNRMTIYVAAVRRGHGEKYISCRTDYGRAYIFEDDSVPASSTPPSSNNGAGSSHVLDRGTKDPLFQAVTAPVQFPALPSSTPGDGVEQPSASPDDASGILPAVPGSV